MKFKNAIDLDGNKITGLADPSASTDAATKGWVVANPGGYSSGTPPTIVQVSGDTTGGASITLGATPTNGNLLVAMCFNPSVASAGTGWTLQVNQGTGTDFGLILTKVAGAGESTTQSPLNSSPGGTGAIVVWEITGQNGSSPFLAGSSQAEQSTNPNISSQFPNLANVLTLGACAVLTTTITAGYGMTQDVLINTGNRRLYAGHSTLTTAAVAELLTLFAANGQSSKSAICLITA